MLGTIDFRRLLSAMQNIRVDAGLSQKAFAAKYGVSPYLIINFENARSNRLTTALYYFKENPYSFIHAIEEATNGTDI